MEPVFNIALVGLVVAALCLAWQPRYLFKVRIDGGSALLAKGKLTAAFLEEIGHVCAEAKIRRGWFGGFRRGRQVVLAFSRSIPPPLQQRLRNLWVLHR